MTKIFRCNDLDIQCNWESNAETEEELFKLVVEHASTAHNVKEINEAMRNKILGVIRNQQ